MEFNFSVLPWQIIFGAGALQQLPAELERRGYRHALVLCTPEQRHHAEAVRELIEARCAGVFDQAVMHVPVETVTQAQNLAASVQADCTVSIGGGSTTGLGKALALKSALPNIAIPTTYAGSEMTNVWGMTEGGRKTTGRDNVVVPTFAIYDPELTLDLPASISGPSGINAMAQAVVNVTATQPNPIISALALDGIRALAVSLPQIIEQPQNLEARTQALYGACLSGAALGVGITGLHHRLCHTLGGSFKTSHADTHAILLAYSVAYNSTSVQDGTSKVAQAMGCDDAARGIWELLQQVSAKTNLKHLGLSQSDLAVAADIAMETPCLNPREVTRDGVLDLLTDAFNGAPPRL
ncbi:MAG: maleylacetate reductase [Gammaproteobacteria bacterium]|jgi:maleylacetate reductase